MKFHNTIILFLGIVLPSLTFAQEKSAIGDVIVAIGSVKAEKQNEPETTLKRGDSLYSLEKVVTDASSKAQLRFIDGGIINLIPQTVFAIDSYVFKNPNKKSELIGNLVKGGLRTISGTVAKENPSGVQIRTAIATIGVRGTIYETLLKEKCLYASCEDGTLLISNEKGKLEIGPQSKTLYASVEEGKAPVALNEKPAALANTSFDVEGGISFGANAGRTAPVTTPTTAPTPAPSPVTTPVQASAGGEGMGGVYDSGFTEQSEFPSGEGYQESSILTSITPLIPIGAIVIAGIVLVSTNKTTNHHKPHPIPRKHPCGPGPCIPCPPSCGNEFAGAVYH